jgi:hypothetical protein
MFDRLTWRRNRHERYYLGLDDEDEDVRDFWEAGEEGRYQANSEAHDTPMAELARIADAVEAGRIELPPRWKLDRPSPGVQVWTTPSGRRYACDPTGELLPLPHGEATFYSWAS